MTKGRRAYIINFENSILIIELFSIIVIFNFCLKSKKQSKDKNDVEILATG